MKALMGDLQRISECGDGALSKAWIYSMSRPFPDEAGMEGGNSGVGLRTVTVNERAHWLLSGHLFFILYITLLVGYTRD